MKPFYNIERNIYKKWNFKTPVKNILHKNINEYLVKEFILLLCMVLYLFKSSLFLFLRQSAISSCGSCIPVIIFLLTPFLKTVILSQVQIHFFYAFFQGLLYWFLAKETTSELGSIHKVVKITILHYCCLKRLLVGCGIA